MAAKRKLANRFRPTLDALESRNLMSVTSVILDAGVLKVTLDNGNDNVRIADHIPVISNTAAMTKTTTVATGETTTGSMAMMVNTGAIDSVFAGTVTVTDLTRPNATWTFSRNTVKSIQVDNHNSYGDMNTIISTSSKPTTVDLRNSKGTNHVETGAGNDIVWGSDGNDFISLGAGDDFAAGGLGNDTIIGGLGSDVLLGGDGNDRIVDNLSSTDSNLLYGDAGNDVIFSASRNDVVDGGADIDTVSVKAGTFIVRNAESATITGVPLGNAVTDPRATARQAANRFLAAYGLPPYTAPIFINDSHSGLTSASELHIVQQVKPDATLVTGVYRGDIANVLVTGKPVLAKFGVTWVVYTGYNSTTKLFTFVDMNGVSRTTPLGLHSGDMIY